MKFKYFFVLALILTLWAGTFPCSANPDPASAQKIVLPVEETPIRCALAGERALIITLQGHLITLDLSDCQSLEQGLRPGMIALKSFGQGSIPRDGFRNIYGQGENVIAVTAAGQVMIIPSANIKAPFKSQPIATPQILIGKGSCPLLVDDPGPAESSGRRSRSLGAGAAMPGGWTITNPLAEKQRVIAGPGGIYQQQQEKTSGSGASRWRLALSWPERDTGTPIWKIGFSEKALLVAMNSSMSMGCNGVALISKDETLTPEEVQGSGITALWRRGNGFVLFRLFEKALVLEPGREKFSLISNIGSASLDDMAVLDLDTGSKGTLFVTTAGLFWLKAE